MKTFCSWLLRGCLAALLLTGSAHAGVLLFDNFQQFPAGTALYPTNYAPIVGSFVNITNESGGGSSITVVATNFSGSTQVLFETGTPTYQADYEGFPANLQTDQVLTLSFSLWIPATKAAGHLGGFTVLVPTVDTNNNQAPLIFFGDDGRLLAFTNEPSLSPLDLPFEQIGSWSSLKGTVMTNVLVLDYPAGTFSFSVNGTVMTSMAIPGFLTNVFDAVRLEAFEAITGDGSGDSLGNTFALGNVLLSVPSGSTNQDVAKYVAGAKGQIFDQLSSGAPTPATTNGFLFEININGPGSNTILSAADQIPGGSNIVLSLDDPESSKFKSETFFASKSAMDAVYAGGVYLMTIGTADQGTFTPSETLPGDDYPNTPQVLNFDAAQVINASTNFVFVWNSFTSGTTNDTISFEIDDDSGNTITNSPDTGQPGQLDGTATSYAIPAGLLTPGSTNVALLQFIKLTARDTNSVPGALGLTGYFEATQFSVVAGGTTVCVFAISPTNAIFTAAGGSGSVNITAQTGCAWTATNNNGFIMITSGASGSGNGTVMYSVAATTNFNGQTGTLTIAGQSFTVIQSGAGCTFTLDSTNASFSAAGGSSNVMVTAGTNCDWMAASNSGFINITAGSSGSGNGSVSYTIAANNNAIAQTGSMTIAGQTYTITQAAAACSVAPATTSAGFSAAGGSSNIVITANGTNCAWTASSNSGFINITAGSSGSGTGSVSYTVATNSSTIGQTGSMTVAGQTFTVNQAGVICAFMLDTSAASYSYVGGSNSIGVTANGTNCAWTAVSNDGFITITAGASGAGNGSVSYSVDVNTNAVERHGSMTIAGQDYPISENPSCDFIFSPTSAKFTDKGGAGKIKVTMRGEQCPWTAVSNDSFITITAGSSGTGSGTVSYTVPGNTNDTVLNGSITIAGRTFAITQAAGGCTFALSPKSVKLKASGGPSTVKVTPNLADCDWTAASHDGFITITAGASGTGKGAVSYTVSSNADTVALIGTMTIAGQTFTVDVAAATCEFALGETNATFSSAGGSSNVTVTANGTNCTWKAVAAGSFIHITSGATGAGSGTIDYTVEANTKTAVQKGAITVGKEKLTITQSAAP